MTFFLIFRQTKKMKEEVGELTEEVSMTFKQILEYNIFSLGKYSLSVYEVIAVALIIAVSFGVSVLLKKFIYRSEKIDLGKKYAFSQMFHYVIVVVMIILVLRTLGVNISPLLLGSGAILVGIGLGLQNLFLDFISGVIILIDRTVRVGDIIDVNGVIGQVQEIKMRTTMILTRDNKNMIFPNSMLTKDRLVNFSHNDDIVTFDIEVGVHYDTDIELAEKLMKESALESEHVLADPGPIVRLEGFGDSALNLKMFYSSRSLFRQPRIQSEIRKAILRKFRENKIDIPYPIRTLDFPKAEK